MLLNRNAARKTNKCAIPVVAVDIATRILSFIFVKWPFYSSVFGPLV